MKALRTLTLILLIGLWTGACKPTETAEVSVFVASSTGPAIEEIVRHFERETGIQVLVNQASSSALARQIEKGAPCDLFLSAHAFWVDHIDEGSNVRVKGVDLLTNRLVIVVPVDSAIVLASPSALANLGGRIAMGDPAHVPAGIYGKQALTTLKLYQRVRERIVPTSSVRAALRLVERGEVACGIVYRSDAETSDRVKIVQCLPCDSHDPIVYPLALFSGASPSSRKFYDYLLGPEAMHLFEKHRLSPISSYHPQLAENR